MLLLNYFYFLLSIFYFVPMDETKRVGRSLMVLLAALLLVYVIFFDVHGDKLRIG